MGRYAVSAEVLRTLAAAEPVVLDGRSDPLRLMLRTGAEACEQLVALTQEHTEALRRVSELEDLLAGVIDVFEAMPLPSEGGSWEAFTLVQQIHRVLDQSKSAERDR